ncbi:unnamed protein product [Blepharisma stoltei]|uniref:Palmitoyltransferase n=1 Tax=Blepharisma stoltei TaxID=1481888 RepID=A0AAU9J7I2_9CILI|nr:unnamed protein product [Blepharisma stoltei]
MTDANNQIDDLLQALLSLDTQKFRQILQSQLFEIWDLKTYNGNNIFHEIAISLVREPVAIDYFQQAVIEINTRYPDQNIVKKMLDHPNHDDGKTPLHVAILTGRKKLARIYIDNGADFSLKDNQGQSATHIAASNGQLALLAYFFKELHIPIDLRDNTGKTPLHIAALEGQEQSAGLLIAVTTDMNLKDDEGHTPLHLAAISKSYRIVRHLLMRGASKDIVNNAGSTPLKIAEQIGSPTQIQEVLEKPCILAHINPIRPPIQPIKNSRKTFIFYIAVFIIRYFLIFMCIVPFVHIPVAASSFLIFMLTLITFAASSGIDPGYVKKDSEMSLVDLYEKYNGDFVCPYCEVKRPKSNKHCQHCNRCVQKFDHHCPWINNCVGARNHKWFFSFLFFIEIDFLFHMAISLMLLLDAYGDVSDDPLYDNLNEINQFWEISLIIIFSVCGIAFLLVLPLFYVQVVNLLSNTTTHERFAFKKSARKSGKNLDSDTSSMLLPSEENDLTTMSGISAYGVSEVTIKHTTSCCFCLKREKTLTWSEMNEFEEQEKV